MATRAYRIVSNYTAPRQPEDEDPADVERSWQIGPTFGRRTQPPKFVKSSGLYDEFGRPISHEEDDDEIVFLEERPANLSSWYKNLHRSNPTAPPAEQGRPVAQIQQSASTFLRPSTSDAPWFLSRTLDKVPDSNNSPSSSIPEMLARAPPPLASEKPLEPPIWTAIGPGNRGYSMLQRSGWTEGSGLGIGARRSTRMATPPTKVEEEDVYWTDESESEVQTSEIQAAVEVIDLTEEADEDYLTTRNARAIAAPKEAQVAVGRALLTPLPTIFRGDKSGIGSRGKKKTINQSVDALRFAREDAAKRKRKVQPQSTGGAKAIIRRMKMDRRERSELLTYMNT